MKSLQPHELNKPRTRRLRKKLRVGEFQELGIYLQFTISRDSITLDSALDLWIDFVESKDWMFGGGINDDGLLSGFLCPVHRGSLSEADCLTIQVWADTQSWITSKVTQELQDAWHNFDYSDSGKH